MPTYSSRSETLANTLVIRTTLKRLAADLAMRSQTLGINEKRLKAAYKTLHDKATSDRMLPSYRWTYYRLFFGSDSYGRKLIGGQRPITLNHVKIIRTCLVELALCDKCAPDITDAPSCLAFLAYARAEIAKERPRSLVGGDDQHPAFSSQSPLEDNRPRLSDPRHEVRVEAGPVSSLSTPDSLVAKFARDAFQERRSDQEFVKRFLAPSKGGAFSPFQWTLVVGPPGDGKTRFAIQCLDIAISATYTYAGFLYREDAKSFAAGIEDWTPQQPVMIVIDYPAEVPDTVATIILALSRQAPQFKYPVRLMLLERDALPEWVDVVVPSPLTSAGSLVSSHSYHKNSDGFAYRLTALSPSGLLAIIRGRLPPDYKISDKLLLEILMEVDPYRRHDQQQGTVISPRPLFAAIVGEAISGMLAEGEVYPKSLIQELERDRILEQVIERWRTEFWPDHREPSRFIERRQMHTHENLLLIATMALGLSKEKFDNECPEDMRSKYLPDHSSFESERYRRMAGGDPLITLNRLEPDIIGEFFVLNRLRKMSPKDGKLSPEAQELVDLGLSLGGEGAIAFLIRCAGDFSELWWNVNCLGPTRSSKPMETFARAVAQLYPNMPRHDVLPLLDYVTTAKLNDKKLQDLLWRQKIEAHALLMGFVRRVGYVYPEEGEEE